MSINVTRSSMPPFREYCDEISALWDSRWLTNRGIKHQALEEALKSFLDAPHVSLFVNGHLALEGVLRAMRLEGEVITTPFTYASTTHAIVRAGLTPVFCDIRPDDYTIDPAKIEALITEKTSAILPVHVYGNLCDTASIRAIAERHRLKVIYDAAHAFGVRQNGVSAAVFGDAAMFSFHATKVFNTIEGGAVCFQEPSLTEPLEEEKCFGLDDFTYAGGNAKMNEFQAAMGICNLRHVREEIEKRRQVAERYIRNLSGQPHIRCWKPQNGTSPNFAYFPVFFDAPQFGFSRDDICDLLAEHDIFARKYFYPLTSQFPCYQGKHSPGNTPTAAAAAANVLCLPMYADLEADTADRICDLIIKANKELNV